MVEKGLAATGVAPQHHATYTRTRKQARARARGHATKEERRLHLGVVAPAAQMRGCADERGEKKEEGCQ